MTLICISLFSPSMISASLSLLDITERKFFTFSISSYSGCLNIFSAPVSTTSSSRGREYSFKAAITSLMTCLYCPKSARTDSSTSLIAASSFPSNSLLMILEAPSRSSSVMFSGISIKLSRKIRSLVIMTSRAFPSPQGKSARLFKVSASACGEIATEV